MAEELNSRKLKAAHLVALGEMTFEQIAETIGVHWRTLFEWRQQPEFQAEVQRQCRQFANELMPLAVRRLKHNISKAKDSDSNPALKLAFQVAGWLEKAGNEQFQPEGPSGFVVSEGKRDGWRDMDA